MTDRPSNRWQDLPTESEHPDSTDLDTRSTIEIVDLLLREDRRAIERASEQSATISATADLVAETLQAGGRVLLVGAGTSGRLGVLEAAECPPTFGTDPQSISAAIAGGRGAVFEAVEGAEDRADDGEAAAESLGSRDLLIAISASSVTPFALGALKAARGRGTRTVLLTCAPLGDLSSAADRVIALDTGPEILSGSTRLKAGSATKAALNAITTAAMVRLGKVYGNLMVDLRPGSAKLVDRAQRIVARAAGVESEEAADTLRRAEGEVKTAIIMAVCSVTASRAREALERSLGHTRAAIEQLRTG